ncbi:MAG: hypothetical protein OEY03_01385 [Rhizobacter sp.]|nr:hypothetical protein [Rhizobacter sp.]
MISKGMGRDAPAGQRECAARRPRGDGETALPTPPERPASRAGIATILMDHARVPHLGLLLAIATPGVARLGDPQPAFFSTAAGLGLGAWFASSRGAFFLVTFLLVAFLLVAFLSVACFRVAWCVTAFLRADASLEFFAARGAGESALLAAELPVPSSAALNTTAGGTGIGGVAGAATGNAAGTAVDVCGSGMPFVGASGTWAKLWAALASRAAVHNRVRVVVMVHGFLADS